MIVDHADRLHISVTDCRANELKAVTVNDDGEILLAGEFASVNGTLAPRLARVLSNGQVDPNFSSGTGPDGLIECLALNGAGEIIIGGAFNDFDGTESPHLAKLLTGGVLDSTFTISTGSRVKSVAITPDGMIVAGGSFHTVNGESSAYVCRLDDLGNSDSSFSSTLQRSFAIEAGIDVVAVQAVIECNAAIV